MAEDEFEQVPKLPPDARLESLDQRLDKAQAEEAERTRTAPVDPNYRIGQQVLGYLLGGPIGGALLGIGLDYLLGTRPWLLLTMLLLGFAVGVRSIMRISKSPLAGKPGQQARGKG